MAQRIEVIGMKELVLSLKALGSKFERNVPTAAVRAGAIVLREAIRARTPIGTEPKRGQYPHSPGNLKRSIGISSTGRLKAAWKGFKVGPMSGGWPLKSGRQRADGYYGRWVERGHRVGIRGIRGGGAIAAVRHAIHDREFGRQDVPPHPFMRPAFEASKNQALNRFEEVARQRTREAIESVSKSLPGGGNG